MQYGIPCAHIMTAFRYVYQKGLLTEEGKEAEVE